MWKSSSTYQLSTVHATCDGIYVLCMTMNLTTARCKTYGHDLDGPVFREKIKGVIRWVLYADCDRCGTRRIDVMMPNTCELVSRHYDYDNAPEYDKSEDRSKARKFLLRGRLQS